MFDIKLSYYQLKARAVVQNERPMYETKLIMEVLSISFIVINWITKSKILKYFKNPSTIKTHNYTNTNNYFSNSRFMISTSC